MLTIIMPPCMCYWATSSSGEYAILISGADGFTIFRAKGYMEAAREEREKYVLSAAKMAAEIYHVEMRYSDALEELLDCGEI